MRTILFMITMFVFSPALTYAGKANPMHVIAKEPVTMMDLGILKLNSFLSRPSEPWLRDAKIGARFDARRGILEIKASMPVKKASKESCKKIIDKTKSIFVKTFVDKKIAKKRKVSNIHYYFEHEGTGYWNKLNWKALPNYVEIKGIAITRKNFQHSVYCKSKLMSKKVTY